MPAWILVVYIMGQPVTAYTVPGFMYELHCTRAGEALVAHAARSKLPRLTFTCVEQPSRG
jgi:hypothetical protein